MQLVQTEKLPEKGVYTLVILLTAKINLQSIGGKRSTLEKGYYAYTGSALGKGATSLRKRVQRHLKKNKNTHWHIDHLLANDKAEVVAVIAARTDSHQECRINRSIQTIKGTTIPIVGFGASDCKQGCKSHLVYSAQRNVQKQIAGVYSSLFERGSMSCLTLNRPAVPRQGSEG